jgi:hypothetical protein
MAHLHNVGGLLQGTSGDSFFWSEAGGEQRRCTGVQRAAQAANSLNQWIDRNAFHLQLAT